MMTGHKTDNKSRNRRILLTVIVIVVLGIFAAIWVFVGSVGSGRWGTLGTILTIAFPVVAVLFSSISFFLSFRSPNESIEQPKSQAAPSQTYFVSAINQQLPPLIEVQGFPLPTDIPSAYMNASTPSATEPLAGNAYQGRDLRKDFFVSYSRDDQKWAEWIAWRLEDEHFTTVLPAWDYSPRTDINIMIDETLKEAKRMLLVLSPAYLDELKKQRAVVGILKRSFESTEDKVIPVCVKECKEQLLKLFGSITYVDLVGLSEDEAQAALISRLRRRRAKPKSPPAFPG